MSVAEEAIGAASAPVADGADTRHGEASHQPPQPAEPPAGDAAPAEAGAGEAAPAAPSAETEPHPAPPGSGSTMPEPTLVTEKPANPKRGWWQRLMQS